MLNILVTGSNGQLGSEIKELILGSEASRNANPWRSPLRVPHSDVEETQGGTKVPHPKSTLGCMTSVPHSDVEETGGGVKTPHPNSESVLPRFHHISTDEVYGTLTDDPNDLFTEKTPYAPNSPYSASKASSDMIVRAYVETFGLNAVITNCSNNYGPKQHDEKLIPTIIRNALNGNPIPIYGDGKNIRDWLYVLDHCKGIDLVYHEGKKGETYNIGGRNERTNLQIVDRICQILDEKVPRQSRLDSVSEHGMTENRHPEQPLRHPELDSGSTSYKDLITFVEDRAGHDRRYAIDATKLENELVWRADETFDTGIVKTVEWYLGKYGIKKRNQNDN